MAALFLPFGYPGYPDKAVREHIADSEKYLTEIGVDFISAEPIINLADCAPAKEIASSGNWDFVIVLISTWIEAPNVMNVLYGAGIENKPLLLWSHDNIWDENEKCTISFGCLASAGVMRETFEEFGFRFRFVIGNPGDEKLTKEVLAFNAAAKTLAKLRNARLGMLGYVSMGMYTGLGDHIKVKKLLGTEIVHVDNYTVLAHLDEPSEADKADVIGRLKSEWSIKAGVEDALLDKTAAYYLQMKKIIKEQELDSLTAKCQYEMSIDYGFTPCVALSLLGEELPCSCEGDIYLMLSQMILSFIADRPSTYGDMLSVLKDGMICAACGFAPKCFLNSDKPEIDKHTALYSGMLITTSFKPQPVTVIRLANSGDGFKLHLIKGHTEELKGFHEIDCPTYAGSVIRFDNKSAEDFKDELMSQHYAIVSGDWTDALKDFCRITGIEVI